MRCPICSTENEEKAHECIACGHPFVIEAKEEKQEPKTRQIDPLEEEASEIDGYGQRCPRPEADGTDDRGDGTADKDGLPQEPPSIEGEEAGRKEVPVKEDAEMSDMEEAAAEAEQSVQEEVRQDEMGQIVSVITVTRQEEPHTMADTEYELHSQALFAEGEPPLTEEEPEAEETPKVGRQVIRTIKDPITARETAMLITMLLLGLLLISVVGYFLVSGRFAQSIQEYRELAQLKESVALLTEIQPESEEASAGLDTQAETAAEESTEAERTSADLSEETSAQTSETESEASEEASADSSEGESEAEESAAADSSETEKETSEPASETESASEESKAETEPASQEAPSPIQEQPDGTILYKEAFVLAQIEGGYGLVSYVGQEPIVIVPKRCQGQRLVAILDNAFANRADVTQVQIPSGVATIGNGAFSNCTGLQVLALPDTLAGIGNNVFDYTGPFVILSHPDTYAQQYCMQMGVPWAEGTRLRRDGAVPEGTVLPVQP